MPKLPSSLTLEILQGSPGLRLEQAVHIMVPGRGRSKKGTGLSKISAERLRFAAAYFASANLPGVFICSGYKTPTEHEGKPWSAATGSEVFEGIPEAYAMSSLLDGLSGDLQRTYGRDVPRNRRSIEAHSIDTVTNFSRLEAENHFGVNNTDPVVIIAQRKHLERIFKTGIPKRTLRREYIGLVVPELPDKTDDDGLLQAVASFIALGNANINKQTPEKVLATTTRNATYLAKIFSIIAKLNGKNAKAYNTDS